VAFSFPEGTGLEAPYTMPAADWAAINRRVSTAIEMQGIAVEVEPYIPNYPDLLAVCEDWSSTTLPGLLAEATSTGLFATDAATQLQAIATHVGGLQPGDPVPAAVKFILTVKFQAFASTAGAHAQNASALTPKIQHFVSVNQATDASIEGQSLPGWSEITAPAAALDQAMTDLEAGWGPIAAGLQAAASDTQVTTADLIGSNVQDAIASWTHLANTTSAFYSTVSTLPAPPTT
jgi:hypothetical protein